MTLPYVAYKQNQEVLKPNQEIYFIKLGPSLAQAMLCCEVKGRLQKVDEIDLLVDPVLLGGGPVAELLRLEPEADLVVGRLNGIGAMADVAPDMDGEVSPDGAGKGSSRVGLTKHYTTSLHCVQTLPNHGADRAAGHVGDQTDRKPPCFFHILHRHGKRRFQPVCPAPVHLHQRRLWPVLHGPPLLRVHQQRGDLRADVQLWQPDLGELPHYYACRRRN